MKKTIIAAVGLFAVAACTEESVDIGPTSFDASGTLECSAGTPSYDEACGWRVVRGSGETAEIWISNIANSEEVSFRVLNFSQGEFTARDGTPVSVQKSGDFWSVSIPGQEYYRFSDALITGG